MAEVDDISTTDTPADLATPTDTPAPADPVDKPFESPFDKKEEEVVEVDPNANPDEEFEKQTEREIEEMSKAAHPGEGFKKVRGKLKESNTRIEELERKIKSYESGDIESSPEYEKIKAKLDSYDEMIKQNKELSDKVSAVDYRETADYKNNILAPYDDIASLAKTLAEKTGVDAGDILSAVSSRDYSEQSSAIDALKADLDDRSYASIIKMADDMTVLYQRESQIEQNATTLLEESRSSSAALSAQERERNDVAYKKSVSTTFDTYQDQIPLFIADDGTESPLSKSLKDQASAVDFEGMTVDQKAFAAMSAVSLAPMITKYREMTKKLAALSARDVIDDSINPRGASAPAPRSGDSPQGYLRGGESPSDAMDRIIDGIS